MLLEQQRGPRRGAQRRARRGPGTSSSIFLDDDMRVEPGFVAAHLALPRRRARASTAAGWGTSTSGPRSGRPRSAATWRPAARTRCAISGPLPWRYFPSNNASVRREDLLAVGGFDPRYRAYGFEDTDLGLRLERERGVRFGFVTGARSTHLESYDLAQVLEKKRICGEHSLRLFLADHPETLPDLGLARWLELAGPGRARGPPARALAVRAPVHPDRPRPRPRLGRRPGGGVPDAVFDFLVLWHFVAGLRT